MIKHGKRFTALALCAALCAAILAGCGSGGNDSSSSSSQSSASSQSSSSMPSSSAPETPESGPQSGESGDDAASGNSGAESSASESPDSTSSAAAYAPGEPTALAGSADFSQIGALDSQAVLWGPGKNFDADNRSVACIELQKKYEKYGSLFIGDASEKKIYLTFDQGYENGYTTKILDTLKEKSVPAVFFLTGHYVQGQGELIQRMIDEGHVLGNHSNRHFDPTEVPMEQVQQDMLELNDMVKEQFGYECRLYRCPEGKFSEQTLAIAQQNGFRPIFWSFAYADWDPENQMPEQDALEHLTARLHNGAIYLLHSVSSTNAAVLGRFIDAARAAGYEFAAV